MLRRWTSSSPPPRPTTAWPSSTTLERATPGSFTEPLTRTDALYFALTVFSTVGFGDITARTETARVMTMIQMAGGILLVGIAARVVVKAVDTGRRRRDPKNM